MVWNIVCDSSCDLRATDVKSESVQFETVPLRLQVGAREFLDNDQLEVPDLLQAMAAEKSASSTACPSPAAFARAFEKGDRTICFTISANLSGTYNAAVMGRELTLEEYPDKQICVIDSKSTAGAMVLLVRRAQALIEADPNVDFEDLCAQLRMYQASLRTCFTLENFDNLIKNGRMRPLVGTLLHSLGIHVIADAHIYDRHMPIVEKMLTQTPAPAPKFAIDPSVTDFYAFTRNSFTMEGYTPAPFEDQIPIAI